MDGQHIISVIEMYEAQLVVAGVPKIRMDENGYFRDLNSEDSLAHAHFLCEGVKKLALDPNKQRKAGSHLTAVQMCLSFAGWYTLGELMEHNRPTSGPLAQQKFIHGVTNFKESPLAT